MVLRLRQHNIGYTVVV